MANWCRNHTEIHINDRLKESLFYFMIMHKGHGIVKSLRPNKEQFAKMILAHGDLDEIGLFSSFMEEDGSYTYDPDFFEIEATIYSEIDETGSSREAILMLRYDTKWSPPQTQMLALSQMYGTTISHQFAEIGAHVGGSITFENGEITDFDNDPERYIAEIYGEDALGGEESDDEDDDSCPDWS